MALSLLPEGVERRNIGAEIITTTCFWDGTLVHPTIIGIALLCVGSSIPLFGIYAQDPVRLTEGCPQCRIAFDTVVVLGDAVGPGMIDAEYNPMAVDGDGRYYVLSGATGAQIKVFSPDGTYLRTTGRSGQGPGEFGMVRGLYVDTAGRLYVPDVLNARVTIFDSEGTLLRTVPAREPLPGFTVLPLAGDSLLLEGHHLTPDMVGFSTHVLAPDGTRVRSFGDPPYAIPSNDPFFHHRAIAPADPERVWIGGWHRYQIELWDLAGTRLQTFVRDPEWFVRADTLLDGRVPPRPSLSSFLQDSIGLLWTAARIPALGWPDAPASTDTVIEVVDPTTGQWLASARLRGTHTRLFGDRLIGGTVIDLDRALVQIVVLKARLEVP